VRGCLWISLAQPSTLSSQLHAMYLFLRPISCGAAVTSLQHRIRRINSEAQMIRKHKLEPSRSRAGLRGLAPCSSEVEVHFESKCDIPVMYTPLGTVFYCAPFSRARDNKPAKVTERSDVPLTALTLQWQVPELCLLAGDVLEEPQPHIWA
jgi:hypothetical protein